MHPNADTIRQLAEQRHDQRVADAAAFRVARAARRQRAGADPVGPEPPAAESPSDSSTDDRRAAVRDLAPVVLGLLPFGTVVGVTIHETSVAPGPGLATALLMFGGTANIAALTLLGSGAGMLTVLAAVAVVNARLLVYGAGLEPRFRHQPAWFRWLGPQLIVDQTFATATVRPELADPVRFRRYWLTAGAVIGSGWCAAIAGGLVLGPVLPSGSPLEIAAPASMVVLLAPRLTNRPGIAAAAAAAVVAVAAAGLPHHGGLLLAVLAGLAAGALADGRTS